MKGPEPDQASRLPLHHRVRRHGQDRDHRHYLVERNVVGNLVGTYNLAELMGARRPGTGAHPHLIPSVQSTTPERWATYASSILEPANAAITLWLDDPFCSED
jgi:hypothetical protein